MVHAAIIAILLVGLPSETAGARHRVGAGGSRIYQSAHFLLSLPRGESPGPLLDELEGAYRHLVGYGLELPRKIAVRCYATTAEFRRASGGSGLHLAVASRGGIHMQPLALLLRRGDLSRALRHELAHVALFDAASRDLPRWMNEGMAMVIAGEKHPERIRFGSLAQLEEALLPPGTHDTIRSAYGAAERLMARMIERYGKGKVLAMLRSIAAGTHHETAFERLAGMKMQQWGERELPVARDRDGAH